LFAEWNVDGEISTRFAHEIEALEPFGVGNRRPLFTTKVGKIKSQPLKSGSLHFSFKTEVLEMLDFNGEKHVYPLSLPIEKTVVFELNLSVFKNRETIKGYVRAIQEDYGDFSNLKLHIFANELDKLTVENNELCNIIDEIDDQIEEIESINKSYVDELNMLRTRAELFDKYEYAIAYGSSGRTELTYEEIKYGEDLMLAKGLNPHLMFGTIMVESAGKPDAVNNESGATGYGQFLDSTAKWVWTKLLGHSTYNSNIRKDGMKNIQMMAEYYDFLYAEHGSTFKVVKQYSGNSTNVGAAKYLAKVNSFTKQVGEVVN
jgi:hypothetical protein